MLGRLADAIIAAAIAAAKAYKPGSVLRTDTERVEATSAAAATCMPRWSERVTAEQGVPIIAGR
jgi:hypothetical protein